MSTEFIAEEAEAGIKADEALVAKKNERVKALKDHDKQLDKTVVVIDDAARLRREHVRTKKAQVTEELTELTGEPPKPKKDADKPDDDSKKKDKADKAKPDDKEPKKDKKKPDADDDSKKKDKASKAKPDDKEPKPKKADKKKSKKNPCPEPSMPPKRSLKDLVAGWSFWAWVISSTFAFLALLAWITFWPGNLLGLVAFIVIFVIFAALTIIAAFFVGGAIGARIDAWLATKRATKAEKPKKAEKATSKTGK